MMTQYSADYVKGWNDALLQAARLMTENYRQCITNLQIEVINLKPGTEIRKERQPSKF